ncbi:hypothetical protein SUGI_0670180 [Cryptomeria japonica]|nr:hypothetical protein SUGI_0670180 [Cryptomeria japonica]
MSTVAVFLASVDTFIQVVEAMKIASWSEEEFHSTEQVQILKVSVVENETVTEQQTPPVNNEVEIATSAVSEETEKTSTVGLAWKHSIDVVVGVIDADYRGIVVVILFNHATSGDPIAQLIIEKNNAGNMAEKMYSKAIEARESLQMEVRHIEGGTNGKVCIRGLTVIKEYQNNSEANRTTFPFGCFYSGQRVFSDLRGLNPNGKDYVLSAYPTIGVANAASGWIFVTVPPDRFGPILGENGPDRNQGNTQSPKHYGGAGRRHDLRTL